MMSNYSTEVEDKKLLEKIIRYIADGDIDPEHSRYAVDNILPFVKQHVTFLDKRGLFNSYYENGDLKKSAKQYIKEEHSEELISMIIVSKATIKNNQYESFIRLVGSKKEYYQRLIRKKLRKFVNNCEIDALVVTKNNESIFKYGYMSDNLTDEKG